MNNLFIRILDNLARPHKIPKKIFNKLNYYFSKKKYNQNFFEEEQNKIFEHFGLNRQEGIKKLISAKNDLNIKSKISEAGSEHEVIFSSLSLSKNKSFTDILEIGTLDGLNAALISKLFPNSNIDTIDLPETDDDFINYYDRKDKVNKFVQDRNLILSESKNINFNALNSLKLLNYKKKYDLIWIDGNHGYPVVCIDIVNSLHILKENGLILCDDVHLKLNESDLDPMIASIATYETLNELKKEDLIDFTLVYKRLGEKHNCIENKRKFVAIVTKKKNTATL